MLNPLGARLSLVAFAIALATCHAPGSPAASPRATTTPAGEAAAAATPPPPERTFDPDVIRLAPGSALARSRAALEAGRGEEAAALATAGLLEEPDALEAGRLRWLLSAAQRAQGQAVASFETLAPIADDEDHPLAPWAQLLRARMALSVDAERALALVAPLAERDWAGAREAQELHVAALAGSGRADEAEPLLRARLADAGEETPRTIALALAELLAARDDDDAKAEAIALFRAVAVRAPVSSVATAAEARVDEVLAALPRARRRALAEVPPEQAVIRAERLSDMLRHEEAEEAFAEVVAATSDEALRCRARYGQGRAIYFRRHRRRSAEHLSAVARECDDLEIRAWSYYLAGKGFTSAGEHDLARAAYARVEADTASHSLADDSRYRAALLDRDDGDEASMVRRLETLAETYPEGDMRGRARFMLAWRARRAGDGPEALRQLEASLAEGPLEDREDLHGRAAYWRASVLAEMGRADEAQAGYLDVVRQANVAYYGQHALSRLAALGEAPATQARAMLGERGDDAIRFAWRDELESPAFAQALELLRVGEMSDARTALAFMRAQSDDPELSWVEAALLDRAGEYSLAVALTRRQLPEFMNEPPAGAHFARWRISYPRAYRSVIESATASLPIPAELVYGIAREESSFRADAVSIAQAYGLTQLILPTAERFGGRIGVRANRQNLTDPDINVRIGSAYMAWLWERYEPNPFLVPPAYNAGQGATDRWLRERPDQRLDEWIEEIPYDETRRYTRRVIQSWGIYGWLNEGALPELPVALPSRG